MQLGNLENPNKLIRRKAIEHYIDQYPFHTTLFLSAPAGYGKSSFIKKWLQDKGYDSISCEGNKGTADQNIRNLLCQLLGHLDSNITIEDTRLNPSINPYQFLISQLSLLKKDLVIILEDYHQWHNQVLDAFFNSIIESNFKHVKLCVLSRKHQDFPSRDMFLNDRVVFIQSDQLKFSLKEMKQFLKTKGNLDNKIIHPIYEMTEGWPAGAQLLSYHKHLTQMTSQHSQLVEDFIIHEILMHETNEIKDFLYKVSYLNDFTPEQCDYVFQYDEGQSIQILNTLIKKDLFVYQSSHGTFRIHNMIRDVLIQTRKVYFDPHEKQVKLEILNNLGKWFVDHHLIPQALEAYKSCQNYDQMQMILSQNWLEMDEDLQLALWQSHALELPDVYVVNNLDLNLAFTWSYLHEGQLQVARKYLENTKALLESKGSHKDLKSFMSLEVYKEYIMAAELFIKVVNSQYRSITEEEQTYHHLSQQYFGAVEILKSCAYWAQGDFKTTEQLIKDSQRYFKGVLTLNLSDITLIDLYYQMGHVKKGFFLLELLEKRIENKTLLMILKPSVLLLRAKYWFYHGDLKEAYKWISLAKEAASHYAMEDFDYQYTKLLVMILIFQNEVNLAQDHLSYFVEIINPNPIPQAFDIDYLQNLLKIKVGIYDLSLIDIADTFEGHRDPLDIMYLLDQGQTEDQILKLIQDHFNHAVSQNRVSGQVSWMYLQGIYYHKRNQRKLSDQCIEKAKGLAMRSGYQLPFMMYDLKDGFLKGDSQVNLRQTLENNKLIEPLTKRELEVLSLLSKGLSNKEIGEQLFVTEETIKSYNKRLYRKLSVKSRNQAVKVAYDIGLIE